MEIQNTEINFLPKPEIDPMNLRYINKSKEVYVNLFDIQITKELKLYQYPFVVHPELESGDIVIRDKLFKDRKVTSLLKGIYGESFVSGDSLYALKKIDQPKSVEKIRLKGGIEYQLDFQPFKKERTIKQEDVHKDVLAKQFIEILIGDILKSNPNLEFYKGMFVLKNQLKTIQSERTSIKFYPGYAASFIETDSGNFLNVTLKNKILSSENILEFLEINNYTNKKNEQIIKDKLIGRSFKVSYAKKNLKIFDIIFDRSPRTQTFGYEGATLNLIEYYQRAHGLEIKNLDQPLILVKKKGPQDKELNLYYVPELCFLAGLDEGEVRDAEFMRNLSAFTKLNPEDRIDKTNEFLYLLVDPTKDNEHPQKLSAKEKSELYGISVRPLNRLFTAYYMEQTKLISGGGNMKTGERVFKVYEKKDMKDWVCFYEKNNYTEAEKLFKTLVKASKGYGFHISEPEWVEMPNKSSTRDWIDTAKEYVGDGKEDFKFAVYLLGKNNETLYAPLKRHSLCENGYVSQVVKTKSLMKNAMSVCSKILLQINAKLEGTSYVTDVGKEVRDKALMIVGINSSHIKGGKTGIAMTATINKTFSNFFNKEIIRENKDKLFKEDISEFIDTASQEYEIYNNGERTKGVVIYRQGVNFTQKEFLKDEIREIDSICKQKGLEYYYILVNTKTSYKFFEIGTKGYSNPFAGLLILDGVTNRNLFEFYIQPQDVTGGSATPTCFHVAYGDLNCPEIIPKLTYDLCHIYANWQGPVRVPNVIKAAEKLSKMTAKYTLKELNEELSQGQAYL